MNPIRIVPMLLLASFSVAFAAEQKPLTVAILDFEGREESVKEMGPKISALLNAQLSAEPNIVLVERAELEKALGEQELGASGTVSTDTAAKIGHLTGAKVLVTGKAFKIEKDLMVVAKIIGTETSRVYGETAKAPAGSALDELTSKLAEKISKVVAAKADTLVAQIPTREDRIQAIKKQVGAAKPLAVSIQIPEQHFGALTSDPAAQTELSLILQGTGFTLVDEHSAAKPDIEITGEAFSAFGARRGNLISCKARIELKARRKSDGKIIAVDRETSVAVDITEQTAAKTALQNAAAELAARIAPKLLDLAAVAAR